MQRQIFPAEIIENSLETYLPRVRQRSQVIYAILLVSFFLMLLSLPFIKVDVSVTAPGVVRTVLEKTDVQSLVAGTVAQVLVHENQLVRRDQQILVLHTHALDTKLRLNQTQQTEKQLFISDLMRLVKLDSTQLFSLKQFSSSLYAQQYNQFRYGLGEMLEQQRKVKKELDADRKLYHDRVIAMRELDEKEYTYRRLLAEYRTFIEKQVTQWQSDLNIHRVALTELQAQERQLYAEKVPYTLRAPVSGHVQQWAGKYTGSYVQSGETLCIVSPDSSLLVECRIDPKDIGLIRPGMPVQFQIDAFNYNEWGLLSGQLVEVGNDFTVADGQVFYKVKCQLATTVIQLKNGAQGHLKKGMSLQARFMLAHRSLYQLLYDKADNWLNPQTHSAINEK